MILLSLRCKFSMYVCLCVYAMCVCVCKMHNSRIVHNAVIPKTEISNAFGIMAQYREILIR